MKALSCMDAKVAWSLSLFRSRISGHNGTSLSKVTECSDKEATALCNSSPMEWGEESDIDFVISFLDQLVSARVSFVASGLVKPVASPFPFWSFRSRTVEFLLDDESLGILDSDSLLALLEEVVGVLDVVSVRSSVWHVAREGNEKSSMSIDLARIGVLSGDGGVSPLPSPL